MPRPRLLLFGLFCAMAVAAPLSGRSAAEPAALVAAAWETDFAELCSKTSEVMSFSRAELQRLVAECDRLQAQIETLPETPRKVFRKRLEMTRKLLIFALEAKSQPAQ